MVKQTPRRSYREGNIAPQSNNLSLLRVCYYRLYLSAWRFYGWGCLFSGIVVGAMVGEGDRVVFVASDVVEVYGEDVEVFVGGSGICGKACEGFSVGISEGL